MKHFSAFGIMMVASLMFLLAAAVSLSTAQTGQGSPPAANRGTAQAPDAAAGGTTATANAKVQFVIGEANVVRVPAETTTITATNLPALDKLSAADLVKQAGSIALTDRGIARGTAVRGTFELLKPEFVGRAGANGLTWRVPLKADVPLGTSHARVLSLFFGVPPDAQTFALEYTVSAKPTTTAQWTPRGATDVWTVSCPGAIFRSHACTVSR